jgi:hypothetical protein
MDMHFHFTPPFSLKNNDEGLSKEGKRMSITTVKIKGKMGFFCHRCGGRMIFEKFYDVSSMFYGWHCVICGEILDPVILLHRLSRDADLKIPEGEENVKYLLKQYLNSRGRAVEAEKV